MSAPSPRRPVPACAPAASAGAHTGHTMAVSTRASADDPDGDGYIPAVPPVTGVTPSEATPPPRYHKEFQANCAVTHTAPDDPIVYPGQPGKSHDHTFMGNRSTNAGSTTASLLRRRHHLSRAGRRLRVLMPSLYKGGQEDPPRRPAGHLLQGRCHRLHSVRPFPKGLRYVVGDPCRAPREFRGHKGFVGGLGVR